MGIPWIELTPASAVPAVEGPAAAGQRAGARHRCPRSAARRGHAGADRALVAGGPAPALRGAGRDRSAGRRSRAAAPADRHPARPGGAATGLAGRGRRRRPAALRADRRGAADTARATGRWSWSRRRRRPPGPRAWPSWRWSTWCPGETLPAGSRVVVSRLGGDDAARAAVGEWSGWAVRTNCCAHADLVVCGGGHGMLSKTLLAGVPMVVVPGGGDQWEMANRVVRQGSARLVRPLTADALVAGGRPRCCRSPRYREAARRAGAEHRRGRRSGTGVPRGDAPAG